MRHPRGGVGVLGLQVRDHFGVVAVPEPEVGVQTDVSVRLQSVWTDGSDGRREASRARSGGRCSGSPRLRLGAGVRRVSSVAQPTIDIIPISG
jgi:hypothetical protein